MKLKKAKLAHKEGDVWVTHIIGVNQMDSSGLGALENMMFFQPHTSKGKPISKEALSKTMDQIKNSDSNIVVYVKNVPKGVYREGYEDIYPGEII